MKKFILFIALFLAWITSAITDKYNDGKRTNRIKSVQRIEQQKKDEQQQNNYEQELRDKIERQNQLLAEKNQQLLKLYQNIKPPLNKRDYLFAIESYLQPKGNTINNIGEPQRKVVIKNDFGFEKGDEIETVEVIYTTPQNQKRLCFFIFRDKIFIKAIEFN